MHISLKVGFGLKPDDKPLTLDEAINQLEIKVDQIGIAHSIQEKEISLWPDNFTFNLEQRVKSAREFRTEKEAIQKQKNISGKHRRQLMKNLQKQKNIWHYDQLRFAHQAIHGSDPVKQRFMHFWWNHFTVGNTNGTNFYTGDLYWDVINKGISGTFSDLLYNVTKHPAMLTYLDNVYSVGEKSQKGLDASNNPSKKLHVGLNDNLARELLELHTLSPKANYTEKDIRNVAKILSGWGYIFNREKDWEWVSSLGVNDPSDAFISRHHEPGDKEVLGKIYAKGFFSSGKDSLRKLTDDLSLNPITIKHLSLKLCKHFINEKPTPEDVSHVENAWINSAGDLKSIHKSVLEKAFQSADIEKFQWPLTWVFSVLRTSGSDIFPGWKNIHSHPSFDRKGGRLYREIGQNFWSRRQPNGFSDEKNDWVSSEHMDRRLRITNIVSSFGNPKVSSTNILEKLQMSQATRELVSLGLNENEKFTLLCCSPEFMGG